MKKYIFILIISSLLLSCNNNDVDSLFSDDIDNRISAKINEYNNVLNSQENGWKLVYFPNPDNMGGYTHLMKFIDGNIVEMMSEKDKDLRIKSSYSIDFSEEIILNFNLNTIITEFSEPSSSSPSGKGGDVEFYIKSVEKDKVVLKGRKLGSDAILIPAKSSEWDSIYDSCVKMEALLGDVKPNEEIVDKWFINKIKGKDGLSVDFRFSKASRTIELGYVKDGVPCKDVQGISFTNNGFELSKPIEINGVLIDAFVYDEDSKQFILDSDKQISLNSYVGVFPEYNYGNEVLKLLSLTDNKDAVYSSTSLQSAKESVRSIIGDVDLGLQLYNSADSTKFSFMCLDKEAWWEDPSWHDMYVEKVVVNSDNSLKFQQYGDLSKQYLKDALSKQITESIEGSVLINKLFNDKGWYVYKSLALKTFAGVSTRYLFISKEDSKDWFYFFSES